MPEENAAERQPENGQPNGEGGSQQPDDKQPAGEGANGAENDGGQGGDGGKPEGQDPKKPADAAPKGEDDPPVRSRKSAKDFIIQRKDRQLQQQRAAAVNPQPAPQPGENGGDELDEKVNTALAKALTPLAEQQAAAQDKAEIDAFVAANPDFKPYADRVMKLAAHESRRSVPVEDLFYSAAGKDLLALGAERHKAAAREAAAGTSPAAGADPTPAKSVKEMTPEEFNAMKHSVRTGGAA